MQAFFSSATHALGFGSNARPLAAQASRDVKAAAQKPVVLVTGAGGKTGKLVAQKVHRSADYSLRALVRTEESKKKLVSELSLTEDEVVVADIAKGNLQGAMQGCSALIVATSATPKLVWTSMPSFFWKRFVMKEKVMPEFTFPQMPEKVDWEGQKYQFDAAKDAGVQHVVLVSSMGGSQPENTLNKIGSGNILVWKRKAEQYLIASGLPYTIIHPGGLKDDAGGKKIILGVNDDLLKRKVRSIARADVAELCVQSLSIPEAKNRSIDCISDAEGTPTVGGEAFQALFKEMAENCDYSINNNPVYTPQ